MNLSHHEKLNKYIQTMTYGFLKYWALYLCLSWHGKIGKWKHVWIIECVSLHLWLTFYEYARNSRNTRTY